jgi:hypothetical protein
VRKGFFIIQVLLVLAVLFPGFAFSRDGGFSGAGRLREALLAGGIAFEEVPGSPGEAGTYEEGAPESGLFLLVRFGQGAASRPEYSGAASPPLLVLSVPLTGASDEIAYYASLCGELKRKPPPSVGTVLIFSGSTGDSFGLSPPGGGDAENGISAYNGIEEDSENILFWRLDFKAFPPQSLRIEYAPEGRKAPLFLVEKLPGLCDSLDIPYTLAGSSAARDDDSGDEGMKFIQDSDIGALRILGLGGGPEEKALDATRLSELIGNYAASLDQEGFASGRLGTNADYRYSLVRLPGGVLAVSEKTKILAALFVFAVINLAAVILLFNIRKESQG